MDRYQLTPFDDRYLKVPYEWMDFTYLRYMENPDSGLLRDFYLFKKIEAEKNADYEEELQSYIPEFKAAGYNKEQYEDIMDKFRETKDGC